MFFICLSSLVSYTFTLAAPGKTYQAVFRCFVAIFTSYQAFLTLFIFTLSLYLYKDR